MPIALHRHGLAACPDCGAQLVVPLRAAGRAARCKCCDARFVLPAAQELFDAAVVYLVNKAYDATDQAAVDQAARSIRIDARVEARLEERQNAPVPDMRIAARRVPRDRAAFARAA